MDGMKEYSMFQMVKDFNINPETNNLSCDKTDIEKQEFLDALINCDNEEFLEDVKNALMGDIYVEVGEGDYFGARCIWYCVKTEIGIKILICSSHRTILRDLTIFHDPDIALDALIKENETATTPDREDVDNMAKVIKVRLQDMWEYLTSSTTH